jgi:hypothetical protein
MNETAKNVGIDTRLLSNINHKQNPNPLATCNMTHGLRSLLAFLAIKNNSKAL